MIPRTYQNEARSAVARAFDLYDSTLLVMATGTGKTVVFSHIAHDWPTGRVLILAHRTELIQQAAEKVKAITGAEAGIEMGLDSVGNSKPKVVAASVQTLARASRRSRFEPDEFGLIVIDEAHHATAKSYREVIGHFPKAKRLGVTATPKRGDGLALGMVFDSVAYEYGIESAIDDGYLVPIRQQVVVVEDLDFSKARTTAGDLNEGDLEAILTEEKIVHRIAAPAVELIGARPALAFCVTVAHAKKLAEVLNRYRPKSAEWLSGESPPEHRAEVVRRFKSGQLQILCNCGLFLEGFDAPNTAAIIMARPTKSLSLYMQVLGRGTRPLPGVVDGHCDAFSRVAAIQASPKQDVLVLDYAGNAGKHKIITVADVLDGKWAAPVRSYYRKTVEEEGRPVMLEEGMARATIELALEQEQQQILARIKAAPTYRTVDESPFDGGGPRRREEPAPRDPPTSAQIWKLVSLGVAEEAARGFTKRQASAVIGKKLRQSESVA